MRLRFRIALLAVTTALVPVFLTSLRAVSIATEEASRASEQILIRDADAMVSFADTWIDGQTRSVAGLLQLLPLEGASEAELDKLVFASFLAVPTVQIAVLVNGEGEPVVPATYLDSRPLPGSPLAGRLPGSEARAEQLVRSLPVPAALAARTTVARAVVGEVYRMEGVTAVPIAATGPYGEELVLGVEASLTELEAEVVARSSQTHAVALLDSEGRAVVGREHPLLDRELLAPLLRSRASVSYTLADGTEVRGAVAPVGSHPWTVVVAEPAVVAERAGAAIRRRTLGSAVTAGLLAVLLGVLVAQSLARPIDRLRETALAVADGQLGRRLEITRRDEIGELSRAFNHMSERLADNQASLAAQQAEIEAFNAELQQRVDAATAELRAAQEQLVRSGQLAAVTEVSAGLAHELNNPLAGILGLAQILGAKASDAGLVELAARIESQAERCREVVAAMTRLSTDDTGPMRGAVVDVRDVLQQLLVVSRAPLLQRGVSVHLADDSEPAAINLDPGFVVRALSPVISTLAAALPAGSAIAVHSRSEAGQVRLELRPDRPIDSSSLRDDRRATSLQLWVSRRLLRAVGGTLDTPEDPAQPWVALLPEAV